MTVTDGTNRGIKNARFCVLRNTRDRAVLVECGFLTNPHDAALAQRASYRQKLAEQICAGMNTAIPCSGRAVLRLLLGCASQPSYFAEAAKGVNGSAGSKRFEVSPE